MTKEEIKLSNKYRCIWCVTYNFQKNKWELSYITHAYWQHENEKDDESLFWKPTRRLARDERDRRNRIIEYKSSHLPITKEQFKDLRQGDVYYYKNKLDEILSKHFCNSKGFNGPTDEALISGEYGNLYWNREDFNIITGTIKSLPYNMKPINLSDDEIETKASEKTDNLYEKAFNITSEELGKTALEAAQKEDKQKIIDSINFLREEYKKLLLKTALDTGIDGDEIEELRCKYFTLDDIEKDLTK